MELFIPLGERYAQPRCCGAERRDAADQFDLVAVTLQDMLQVTESAVDRRVAKCQIDDVSARVEIFFQQRGSFSVLFVHLFPVPDHRHVYRDQCFLCDFRHTALRNPVGG